MSIACDPASDDWTGYFVFTNDDGYLSVTWFPVVGEYSDEGQHVTYVEPGDSVLELLTTLREFTPDSTSTDDENNDEDEDEN